MLKARHLHKTFRKTDELESSDGEASSNVDSSSDDSDGNGPYDSDASRKVENFGSLMTAADTLKAAAATLNATTAVGVSRDFRTDLLERLHTIGHGSFAASGSLPDINPDLYVEGLGKIGLPLSERDAEALAHVCHEAPFGKGSETFVDTNVRETWQIDAHKVRFRNGKWAEQVNYAVSKVIEGLGIVGAAATIRAELYKLLLYEPGALFDTHRE